MWSKWSCLAYKEYVTPFLTASTEIDEKESEQNCAPSKTASSSWSYDIWNSQQKWKGKSFLKKNRLILTLKLIY